MSCSVELVTLFPNLIYSSGYNVILANYYNELTIVHYMAAFAFTNTSVDNKYP